MNWNEVVEQANKEDKALRGKTVGLTFVEGYPKNLYLAFEETTSLPAIIKRNPENPYDTNACEIWVNGSIVGHLPREVAAEVAGQLDSGIPYTLETSLLVQPGKEENPGLAYRLLFNEV